MMLTHDIVLSRSVSSRRLNAGKKPTQHRAITALAAFSVPDDGLHALLAPAIPPVPPHIPRAPMGVLMCYE